MSKHTPGPWKVSSWAAVNTSQPIRLNNGDFAIGADSDEGYIPIAAVTFQGKAKRGEAYKTDDPVGLANACLAAAAPDMYEALERVLGIHFALARRNERDES